MAVKKHSFTIIRRQEAMARTDAEGNVIDNSKRSNLYGHAWRKARILFLRRNPLCVACLAKVPADYTPATEVDHIIPHRGDLKLFWDRDNFSALCKPCHSAKTMKENSEAMKYDR